MASAIFSKAVLTGLRKHGLTASEICSIVGLTQSEIRNVLSQKARLSDSQLAAIERATGLTGGQLAVLSEPSMDAATKALFEKLAKLRNLKQPAVVHSRR